MSNNFTTTVSVAIFISIVQLSSIGLAGYNLFTYDKKTMINIVPMAVFGLYGIFCSVVIAYGRASEGNIQALSRRYCTLSLPFVLIFIVSVLINLKYLNFKSKKVTFVLNYVIPFSLFVFVFLYQYRFFNFAIIRNQETILAKKAILNSDFFNPLVKTTIYPNPERLKNKVLILKKYQMSMYKK